MHAQVIQDWVLSCLEMLLRSVFIMNNFAMDAVARTRLLKEKNT